MGPIVSMTDWLKGKYFHLDWIQVGVGEGRLKANEKEKVEKSEAWTNRNPITQLAFEKRNKFIVSNPR